MAKLKPEQTDFDELVRNIDTGVIKLPDFQRDFVWGIDGVTKLLDSIYRGFPIGSFVFWETDTHLKTVRDLGSLTLPETPEGKFGMYVLDGQQRITSLYAAIKEATIKSRRYANPRKYLIFFDLDEKKFYAESDLNGNVDP